MDTLDIKIKYKTQNNESFNAAIIEYMKKLYTEQTIYCELHSLQSYYDIINQDFHRFFITDLRYACGEIIEIYGDSKNKMLKLRLLDNMAGNLLKHADRDKFYAQPRIMMNPENNFIIILSFDIIAELEVSKDELRNRIQIRI